MKIQNEKNLGAFHHSPSFKRHVAFAFTCLECVYYSTVTYFTDSGMAKNKFLYFTHCRFIFHIFFMYV